MRYVHHSIRAIAIFAAFVGGDSLFGQEDDADLARQFREGVARAAQKLRDPSFVLRARCRHSSELVSISAEWRKKYGPGYAAQTGPHGGVDH